MSSIAGTHISDQKQDTGSTTVSQYMSFLINGRSYAVPLSQVAEITPYQELNKMPHTPRGVEGLLDLRGSVLPIVSLRTRMGLPKKEKHETDHILILAHDGGTRTGVLVDQVESVITATEEQHAPISPMLEGQDGVWVREILLRDGKVTLVLEPESLARISKSEHNLLRTVIPGADNDDVELMLDDSLNKLIAMAGPKEDGKVVPQIETAISHTESEMTKVLERIESMLVCTDNAFTGISRFKQEVAANGLKGFDEGLNKLNDVTQELQNSVFDVLNQLQFQDIVRQKLERVLRSIAGMGNVISSGLD